MTYDEQAKRAEKGADALTLVISALRPELTRVERDILQVAERILRDKAKQAKLNALSAKRAESDPVYGKRAREDDKCEHGGGCVHEVERFEREVHPSQDPVNPLSFCQ